MSAKFPMGGAGPFLARSLYSFNLIHIDFEVAMHNVLKETFPEETIKYCRFHVGQAWWRKIHPLGLCQDYKEAVAK